MSAEPLIRVISGMPRRQGSRLPADFAPVLLKLSSESSSHFGCADARLEPVEYQERPFSHLLRVAVFAAGRSIPLTHVFVKIFKVPGQSDHERMRRRVKKDFESTSKIHQAMTQWRDSGAVRPIACYPEHLANVTEQVPGHTLLEYLHSNVAWVPWRSTLMRLSPTMEKVGQWVRAFQSIDHQPGRVSVGALQSYVDARLERLVAASAAAFGETERARVLEYIERLYAVAPPDDLLETSIHGDLAPANMLISGERVVVLDFAMCGRGSVFHDLSRLFLQLDLLKLKPHFNSGVIDRLGRSLLRGFDPQLTLDRPMFRVLLMQHRINHLATLFLSHERFPANLYSMRVRRYHRACLERELRRRPEDGAHV